MTAIGVKEKGNELIQEIGSNENLLEAVPCYVKKLKKDTFFHPAAIASFIQR